MGSPHFHYGKLVAGAQREQCEGNADVVVQVALRGAYFKSAGKHPAQELLGRGLAVAAGQTQNRDAHPHPVQGCSLLKGGEDILHDNHPFGVRITAGIVGNHSGSGGLQSGGDEIVPVEIFAFKGKKDIARSDLPRVGRYPKSVFAEDPVDFVRSYSSFSVVRFLDFFQWSPHTKNAAETPPRFPILRRGLHTHHFILKGFVFFNIGLIVQTDVDIAQDAYQTQFVGKDFASPFEQIGYALVQRLFLRYEIIVLFLLLGIEIQRQLVDLLIDPLFVIQHGGSQVDISIDILGIGLDGFLVILDGFFPFSPFLP